MEIHKLSSLLAEAVGLVPRRTQSFTIHVEEGSLIKVEARCLTHDNQIKEVIKILQSVECTWKDKEDADANS